jgi:hypothetical protein
VTGPASFALHIVGASSASPHSLLHTLVMPVIPSVLSFLAMTLTLVARSHGQVTVLAPAGPVDSTSPDPTFTFIADAGGVSTFTAMTTDSEAGVASRASARPVHLSRTPTPCSHADSRHCHFCCQ